MKILIVSTYDIGGGAARAAYRLHKALLTKNIDSKMLVQNKLSDDYTVLTEENKISKLINKFRPIIDAIPLKKYKNRDKALFSSNWFSSKTIDKINKFNPDIVHLHWINHGMIKIEHLSKIKAPIIWSLHDMWSFTGGCHYSSECSKYTASCGNCPVLGSSNLHDLSHKIWKQKQKTYAQIPNMTIIGLSRWLANCASSSTLLKNKNIINLPNPIDTSIFKPLNKEQARELWNLPECKKLVLFGALGGTNDFRKGFKELSDALQELTVKDVELVIFGSNTPKESQKFGFPTHYMGHLHDDVSLATLYSAADVMIVPSLQENLSNAIMESLACGTPVVGFNIGGNGDMIEHQINGYLAEPFNASDLARGIDWVLNAPNYGELSNNARKKITTSFESTVVAQKYIELYKGLLV